VSWHADCGVGPVHRIAPMKEQTFYCSVLAVTAIEL